MADEDRSTSVTIRQAIELIEQAPAEVLYTRLLETLTQAGAEADMRGARDVAKKMAFAYKLTVELGGKLSVLSEEDLAWRRRLAALLFGEGKPPTWDEAFEQTKAALGRLGDLGSAGNPDRFPSEQGPAL